MNITTRDIQNYEKRIESYMRDNPDYEDEVRERGIKNMELQTDFVALNPSICSKSEAKAIEGKLDAKKLQSTMGNNFTIMK